MRRSRSLGATIAAALAAPLAAACASLAVAAPAASADELLVKLPATRAASGSLAPLSVMAGPELIGGFRLVTTPHGVRAADLVRSIPGAVVQPNRRVYPADAGAPNDPLFAHQWSLWNVGQTRGASGVDLDLLAAWEAAPRLAPVNVAVLDTGVDVNHRDLAGQLWVNAGETGTDELGRDKATNRLDDDGNGYVDDRYGYDTLYDRPLDLALPGEHATNVAGIIAAKRNNDIGSAGIAPNARVSSVQVLDDGGGSDESIIAGITYAVQAKAKIINLSLGRYADIAAEYPYGATPLCQAVGAARAAGVLVVVAAGNDHDPWPYLPAACPAATAVGSTDFMDELSSFSNVSYTGSQYPRLRHVVTLSAPGEEIMSLTQSNTYRAMTGTSMAAPAAVGVAAILAGLDPAATPEQLQDALVRGGITNPSLIGRVGPRVDALRAVRALGNPAVKTLIRPVATSDAVDPDMQLLLGVRDSTPYVQAAAPRFLLDASVLQLEPTSINVRVDRGAWKVLRPAQLDRLPATAGRRAAVVVPWVALAPGAHLVEMQVIDDVDGEMSPVSGTVCALGGAPVGLRVGLVTGPKAVRLKLTAPYRGLATSYLLRYSGKVVRERGSVATFRKGPRRVPVAIEAYTHGVLVARATVSARVAAFKR